MMDLVRKWREEAQKELSRVRTDAPERAPLHLANAQVLRWCAKELEELLTQTNMFDSPRGSDD